MYIYSYCVLFTLCMNVILALTGMCKKQSYRMVMRSILCHSHTCILSSLLLFHHVQQHSGLKRMFLPIVYYVKHHDPRLDHCLLCVDHYTTEVWQGCSVDRVSDSRSKDLRLRFEPHQEHKKICESFSASTTPVCIRTLKNDHVHTLKIL